MSNLIKAVLVKNDTPNQEVSIEMIEIEKEGESLGYKKINELIECDTMDVVMVANEIDMFVDDNGLLVSGNQVNEISFADNSLKENLYLAGNILMLSHDDEGNSTTLNEEQLRYIFENIKITPYGMTR